MAHSFLFPPSNYPQTYADELYSPLNTLNDPLSRTDFSRTLTRTNSVSFGSNLSQNAPIYYTSAFDSPIKLQQPCLIHTSAVLALRIRTRLQRQFWNQPLILCWWRLTIKLIVTYTRSICVQNTSWKFRCKLSPAHVAHICPQMYAIRKLVAELKEELREARNLTKRDNSANDPAPRTPSIKIPDVPPPANRDDFPKARFWRDRKSVV